MARAVFFGLTGIAWLTSDFSANGSSAPPTGVPGREAAGRVAPEGRAGEGFPAADFPPADAEAPPAGWAAVADPGAGLDNGLDCPGAAAGRWGVAATGLAGPFPDIDAPQKGQFSASSSMTD